MKVSRALLINFIGASPLWYKRLIVIFLLANPVLYLLLISLDLPAGFIVGWLIMLQFIFTLTMALKCYPLQPGGLLALEGVLMGLTSPEDIYAEITANLPVILLLMFMVAGVYYLRDLLLFSFTNLLLKIRNPNLLSLIFLLVSSLMSAFLDALTVTAVLISVCSGFYRVYHQVASGLKISDPKVIDDPDGQIDYKRLSSDRSIAPEALQELDAFRGFLRGLLMHSLVGTALGGVATIVGEPQNILIANYAGWDFMTFLHFMLPVTIPTLIAGVITLYFVQKLHLFDYGQPLPASVLATLQVYDENQRTKRTTRQRSILVVQALGVVVLSIGLIFHIAEVGLLGLMLIVTMTAFNGITEEHKLGAAFHEGLPFVSLLVVFFVVVAIIHDQHLFSPITQFVLQADAHVRPLLLYAANGVLSAISDNVFVASVYITEIHQAYEAGKLTREEFDMLAVAVNVGTNIPSIATPNGQAAFLFMLTSSLAPLIRLSYMKMLYMALPYTVTLSIASFTALYFYPA